MKINKSHKLYPCGGNEYAIVIFDVVVRLFTILRIDILSEPKLDLTDLMDSSGVCSF
jgi:hypothetical protein